MDTIDIPPISERLQVRGGFAIVFVDHLGPYGIHMTDGRIQLTRGQSKALRKALKRAEQKLAT